MKIIIGNWLRELKNIKSLIGNGNLRLIIYEITLVNWKKIIKVHIKHF